MNVWIANPFDNLPPEGARPQRYWLMARAFARAGHAVTLWPNGRIKIEGSRSEYLFGVSPKDAGLPEFDSNGRYTRPVIQSADMTFNYT